MKERVLMAFLSNYEFFIFVNNKVTVNTSANITQSYSTISGRLRAIRETIELEWNGKR